MNVFTELYQKRRVACNSPERNEKGVDSEEDEEYTFRDERILDRDEDASISLCFRPTADQEDCSSWFSGEEDGEEDEDFLRAVESHMSVMEKKDDVRLLQSDVEKVMGEAIDLVYKSKLRSAFRIVGKYVRRRRETLIEHAFLALKRWETPVDEFESYITQEDTSVLLEDGEETTVSSFFSETRSSPHARESHFNESEPSPFTTQRTPIAYERDSYSFVRNNDDNDDDDVTRLEDITNRMSSVVLDTSEIHNDERTTHKNASQSVCSDISECGFSPAVVRPSNARAGRNRSCRRVYNALPVCEMKDKDAPSNSDDRSHDDSETSAIRWMHERESISTNNVGGVLQSNDPCVLRNVCVRFLSTPRRTARDGKGTLLVVPKALLREWSSVLVRDNDLRVHCHHPREPLKLAIRSADVVIASDAAILARDVVHKPRGGENMTSWMSKKPFDPRTINDNEKCSRLHRLRWNRLVVLMDDSLCWNRLVKPSSRRYQAYATLNARRRWFCVVGGDQRRKQILALKLAGLDEPSAAIARLAAKVCARECRNARFPMFAFTSTRTRACAPDDALRDERCQSVNTMTCAELREHLRARDMKVSGRKAVLVERLLSAWP